jgi:hypothetical protein
MYEQM